MGCEREFERVPSMSLLVASLPEVNIRPFHLRQTDLESLKDVHDWERIVGVAPESSHVFLVLADPFRLAIHDYIDRMNDVFATAPLIGGIASAGVMPEQNQLILGGDIHREGLVGVALSGRLVVDTVESQGVRAIGTPFVITQGDRNSVRELG